MKNKLIALDLDGVVFDFLGQFLRVHNLRNNTRITAEDITSFMPDDGLTSLISGGEWAESFAFFEESGGYATLKTFEGVRTALENIIKMGHKLVFITSRPAKYEKHTRLALLLNKLPKADIYFVPEGKYSTLFNLQPDVFVDDNVHNCQSATDAGVSKIYLCHAPYNRNINSYEKIYNLIMLERSLV